MVHHTLLSADTLVGNCVKNSQNENLGTIKSIMLDTGRGKVAYAVLSFGGFLGLGDKLFAIPWSSLKLDTEEKCFRFDVDKDRLKEAKGFDKDNWPNFTDPTWNRDTYSFWGQTPYWS